MHTHPSAAEVPALSALLEASTRLALEAGALFAATAATATFPVTESGIQCINFGPPRSDDDHAHADEEAEKFLRQGLLAAFACNYLGEETGALDVGSDWTWVVDPNDGTRAWTQGRRGAAVSIALLHQGVPVLGVVHLHDWCFGANLFTWAKGEPLRQNHQPVAAPPQGSPLTAQDCVLVSDSADRTLEAVVFNANVVKPARFIGLPSIAARLAKVSFGEAAAATSLNGPCAWDIAGGHALLIGAGLTLLDLEGAPITYHWNGRLTRPIQGCVGAARPVAESLAQRDWNFTPPAKPTPTGLLRLNRWSCDFHAYFHYNRFYSKHAPVGAITKKQDGFLGRASGCLLGQLIGDALGSQVEFKFHAEAAGILRKNNYAIGPSHMWGTVAGQPTDDSEQALALARGILRAGHYDHATALDDLVAWSKHAWDIGRTTATALKAAARAKDPLAAVREHADPDSQANGSLMRIAPLGIFCAGSLDDRDFQKARQNSALTHPHPVCQDACAVFVAAIRCAILADWKFQEIHAPIPREKVWEAACRKARTEEVRDVLLSARHESTAVWGERVLTQRGELSQWPHWAQKGWVLASLHNAFHQLLHAKDFEDALIETVKLGGDADTHGAICGALYGAWCGEIGLPVRWINTVLSCRPTQESGSLHPQPPQYWPVDARTIAEQLLAAGAKKSATID